MPNPPKFKTLEAALQWLVDYLYDQNEYCIDKGRKTFCDDPEGMAEYDTIRARGCCGFMDIDVTVKGRKARVGCNYGH